MIDITTRRTIRKYTAEDVPSDLLNELLKRAERTQTMGNLQLYSVVATRDPANKSRLAPLHFNQPMVQNAPVVLTFCADFHRTTEWAQRRKGHPGYDNFLSFLNAASDALLFCQTFCHLAEEAGLGLCYLGTTLYNASGIIDALALPRLVMPLATITLGWPAEEPPLTDRLPLSAILHEEKYQPITNESIDRDYRYKESLPENQRFVEENQKETLAQVFTDCRYTKRDNEALSATLLEALRRQGFLD
ncbi:nitroreductase family protein [Alloprevotella tannerae]|uniref:nitroreductase family protein n=1 Tax=Alloprevotella tannerae TaxID=76122 RepID=UPI0028897530|nr:nitroreductase family protein [Alloprevotella tannerae]